MHPVRLEPKRPSSARSCRQGFAATLIAPLAAGTLVLAAGSSVTAASDAVADATARPAATAATTAAATATPAAAATAAASSSAATTAPVAADGRGDASLDAASGATVEAGLEQYRQMLADGNPAELIAMAGEQVWQTPAGPANASLQGCDLGLGPGVVKGAYARMPRYFADTGRVMDFESRLVHCMVTLQGRDEQKLIAKPFSSVGEPATELEELTAYVVEQSRSMELRPPQSHPAEQAAAQRGERIFNFSGGTHDFACATCHSRDGQRIRLQELPNLTRPEQARRSITSWPAYRLSQGQFRTMQWRLNDCFRQQRFPELKYGSPVSIDLLTYLAAKASGGTMQAPGIKR